MATRAWSPLPVISSPMTSNPIDDACRNDSKGGVRNIVLDMAGIASIDSAGMEALLWTSEEAVQRSGRLKLVSTGTTVSEVLRITRLVRRFDIANTVEDAARALR